MSEHDFRIKKGLLCISICKRCMNELLEHTMRYKYILLDRGKIILSDFDIVYGRLLEQGRMNLLRSHCPHEARVRYYIPCEEITVYLGEPLRLGIHDYGRVVLALTIKESTRTKLICRMGLSYHLLQQRDANIIQDDEEDDLYEVILR